MSKRKMDRGHSLNDRLVRSVFSHKLAEFDKVCEKLRSLFIGEYQRGSRDTAQRILGLVGTNDDGASSVVRRSMEISRVPRGTAKVFVEKCLERGPATIGEIRSQAKTPVERMLSYQTIRLALLRGIGDKRYKKNKKHFSLG